MSSKKSLVFQIGGAVVKITQFQNNGQIIKHFTDGHCCIYQVCFTILLLSSTFKCPFACFKCQKKIDSFCSDECHEFH